MENREIMNNDVIEATEEVIETGSKKGLKIVAGIGMGVVVAGLLYKYVAKPVVAKIKTKIKQKKTDFEDFDYMDDLELDEK